MNNNREIPSCTIRFASMFSRSFLVRILVVVFLLSRADAAGMMCSQSLYAQRVKDVTGVIVRSWDFPENSWTMSGYDPQSTNYALQPYPFNNPDETRPSHKYMKLDWIASWTGGSTYSTKNYLKIDYQRKARTYLYVFAHYNSEAKPVLPGWNSDGWAKRPSGIEPAKFEIGVDERKYTFGMSTSGYVFWTEGYGVTIPTRVYLAKQISGLSTNGHYSVLISEIGGKPPSPLTKNVVGGQGAEPGKLCPSWLHEEWTVPGFDKNDPDTRNRKFATWHPLFDPCFHCTYGHEHGSSAPLLMDYWPRYGYMAWKNGKEKESHEGFKDYVLVVGEYSVYYNVHAQISYKRRFTERFHTNVVVVKHRNKLDLELVHIQFKTDYGPLVGVNREGKFVGLTPEDEKLRKRLGNIPTMRRQVRIETMPHDIQYEVWATRPMCSSVQGWREPMVLIKDQQTGLKNLRLRADEIVQFKKHYGVNREFRARNWVISAKNCKFELPDGTGAFYTNPYGTELRPGPSSSSAYQYIHPGFEITISGFFEVTDRWTGEYHDGAAGSMPNVQYGVIRAKN